MECLNILSVSFVMFYNFYYSLVLPIMLAVDNGTHEELWLGRRSTSRIDGRPQTVLPIPEIDLGSRGYYEAKTYHTIHSIAST